MKIGPPLPTTFYNIWDCVIYFFLYIRALYSKDVTLQWRVFTNHRSDCKPHLLNDTWGRNHNNVTGRDQYVDWDPCWLKRSNTYILGRPFSWFITMVASEKAPEYIFSKSQNQIWSTPLQKICYRITKYQLLLKDLLSCSSDKEVRWASKLLQGSLYPVQKINIKVIHLVLAIASLFAF